ncbi:MAG: hypothetical protein N2C14_03735 [Planctomycetales bacterium]
MGQRERDSDAMDETGARLLKQEATARPTKHVLGSRTQVENGLVVVCRWRIADR